VQYGALVEEARIVLEQERTPGPAERFLRWLGLRQLMPHRDRLKSVAWLLWCYQLTGLQYLVRASGLLPQPLKAMDAIVPTIVPRYRDYRAPAPALGQQRGRVAFFTGCIQEALLSPVNEATIRVLQRNGYEVHIPLEQTCCGAAHIHTGDEEQALHLARRNIDAFDHAEFDAIINNAGGCGLVLKEYPSLLHDDPRYAARASQIAARVQDVSEFLANNLRTPPSGTVRARATYADSCHLRHGQRVVAQPRDLLRRIPGLDVVELPHADQCCGSAGVYNITQVTTANAILDAKMTSIAATQADVIVTSNTGCYLQLLAGVRRAGLKAQVRHVVEMLEQSYQEQAGGQAHS
jgi:glycolate oxidase iron-sulfur subunit